MTPITLSEFPSEQSNRTASLSHPVRSKPERARLRAELTRQRASLLSDWSFALGLPDEQTPFSDLADQASNDLAHDLEHRVKMRMLAKLKRIERALLLLRTKHYGSCRQCRKSIPYERLAVQPATRFCVPCLALIESRIAKN